MNIFKKPAAFRLSLFEPRELRIGDRRSFGSLSYLTEKQCKGTAFLRPTQLFPLANTFLRVFAQVIAHILREIHHFRDIHPISVGQHLAVGFAVLAFFLPSVQQGVQSLHTAFCASYVSLQPLCQLRLTDSLHHTPP